jgi:RNA polymerase sigma factor (sigma-70 family)
VEKLNDPAYVQELANGDPEHLCELTEYLLPKIRDYISRLPFSPKGSDCDLAHETMLKIYRNPDVLRGRDRYGVLNYIFKVAKNTAINVVNKASNRLEVSLDDHAAHPGEQNEDEAGGGNVKNSQLVAHTPDPVEVRAVNEALERLTDKERDVVTSLDGIGMTPEDVAQSEGVPVNTIHVRHKRARANFRKHFNAAYDNVEQA